MNKNKTALKLARCLMVTLLLTMIIATFAMPAQAAERPLSAKLPAGTHIVMTLSGTGIDEVDSMFSNLSQFLGGICKLVGGLLVLFGIVQIGMSIPQHDSSQKMMGFLFLAGGIIVFFAPEILDFINGTA